MSLNFDVSSSIKPLLQQVQKLALWNDFTTAEQMNEPHFYFTSKELNSVQLATVITNSYVLFIILTYFWLV